MLASLSSRAFTRCGRFRWAHIGDDTGTCLTCSLSSRVVAPSIPCTSSYRHCASLHDRRNHSTSFLGVHDVYASGPEIASSFSYLSGIRLLPQASLRRSSPHVSFATAFGFPVIPNAGPSALRLRFLPSPTQAQSARGSRSSRRRRVTDSPISCRAPPASFQWCDTIRGGVCTRPRQATRDAGSELTPRRRMTWHRAPLHRRNDGARGGRGAAPWIASAGNAWCSAHIRPVDRQWLAAPRSFPVSISSCLARQPTRGGRIPRIHLSAAFTHSCSHPSSAASPRMALAPHLMLRF
ncbi:hypothetical protein B0H13DRAFT_2683621 [Mycena leptocephala]|nr:hypothetical protein B0H13DRAFT_2683621 [Mycena leptocephala]